MKNALGEPQTIVLLGGTSDIGLAIVARAAQSGDPRPSCSPARRPESVDEAALELGGRDVTVDVVIVRRPRCRRPTRQLIDDLASPTRRPRRGHRWPSGMLGEQADLDGDAAAAAALGQVNFAGAVSASMATAARFREQGHGQLVVLSSVAGERVRKANFVYGSSKAGLDGFAQGLGDSLAGSGATVLVVRPGFVHSSMTAGLKPAPVRHDTGGGRDGDRQRAALRAANRLGAGHPARGVLGVPAPAGTDLATHEGVICVVPKEI